MACKGSGFRIPYPHRLDIPVDQVLSVSTQPNPPLNGSCSLVLVEDLAWSPFGTDFHHLNGATLATANPDTWVTAWDQVE
jgi:hypothetical protein